MMLGLVLVSPDDRAEVEDVSEAAVGETPS
jgi:hypothetical protein